MSRPTPGDIAARLVGFLDEDVAGWLGDEDVFETLALAYPDLRLAPAAAGLATRSDDCAVDGFYLPESYGGPCVVYRPDVNVERTRFTLLHELGHHLLETSAAELHDAIDECAGARGDCQAAEEAVCQSFAGQLLVPDDLISAVLDGDHLKPRHVVELRQRCEASWMAVAVRLAETVTPCCAVVFLTAPGRIRFAAPSRSAFGAWSTWRSGSVVQPNGPLSTAFQRNAHSQAEVYRWDLGYPASGFCDTLLVDDRLVVAVISDKRSDGVFELLDQLEPAYLSCERWCEHCSEERTEGWCDTCSDRFCPRCWRCGCAAPPISNPTCERCGMQEPHRPGAEMCRTCELDFA